MRLLRRWLKEGRLLTTTAWGGLSCFFLLGEGGVWFWGGGGLLTDAGFDLGPECEPDRVDVVGFGCAGLEDADEGDGDDEEAEAEDCGEAGFLFSVDADEAEEEVEGEGHDFVGLWVSYVFRGGGGRVWYEYVRVQLT